MSLGTNFQRLQDVAVGDGSALGEAIQDLDYSVRQAERLRDLVLQMHRETHSTVAAHLCSEACRLAAEWR